MFRLVVLCHFRCAIQNNQISRNRNIHVKGIGFAYILTSKKEMFHKIKIEKGGSA